MSEVRCVLDARANLAEGPIWDAERGLLWWVDIKVPMLHAFDPESGDDRIFPVPDVLGAAVPRASGGLVLALRDGFYAYDPETAEARVIARPERDRPGNRFNDGKCDRRGRFWAGTMDDAEVEPRGDLYRLDPDGSTAHFPAGFVVTNGLGWSPDDRIMYFTDSVGQVIHAYDYDIETGNIDNRREFVRTDPDGGYPDGLAVDGEGFVWSAHWDGWRVTRYDPDGRVERVLDLPVPRVTSCAFGGADLSTLYITSARVGLDAAGLERAPLSGGIFALQPGVSGLPERGYAG